MRSPKPYIQQFLQHIGLYYRIKASSLYYLYWSLADRSLIEDA